MRLAQPPVTLAVKNCYGCGQCSRLKTNFRNIQGDILIVMFRSNSHSFVIMDYMDAKFNKMQREIECVVFCSSLVKGLSNISVLCDVAGKRL